MTKTRKRQLPTRNESTDPAEAWPERLGTLRISTRFDSPFRIFKLEDAQFGMDVQDGMVDVLTYLATAYGYRLVCIEGASGKIRSDELKSVLRPDDMPRLRRDFEQRSISAVEYLALASDLPLTLVGAENPQQHRANTEALIQAHGSGRVVNDLLDAMDEHVTVLKARLYNPRLQQFEAATAAYDKHELGLGDLVNDVLMPGLVRLGALADTVPELRRFASLVRLERQVVFRKVRLEARDLLNLLLAHLHAPRVDRSLFKRGVRAQLEYERARRGRRGAMRSDHELEIFRRFERRLEGQLRQLAQRASEGQLGASETYVMLVDLALHFQVDIRKFPNFLRYTHYVYRTSRLSRIGLFDQLQRAEELVRESLIENEYERKVARVSRAVSGVRKLCQLEMTPDSADRLMGEFGRLSSAELLSQLSIGDCPFSKQDLVQCAGKVSAELDASGASAQSLLEEAASTLEESRLGRDEATRLYLLTLETALEGAYRFYQLAPLRGRTLAENTLRAMKEHDVCEAILISGGFLTEQVLSVLARESVSYSVLIPRAKESELTRVGYFDSIGRSSQTAAVGMAARGDPSNSRDVDSLVHELWRRLGVQSSTAETS